MQNGDVLACKVCISRLQGPSVATSGVIGVIKIGMKALGINHSHVCKACTAHMNDYMLGSRVCIFRLPDLSVATSVAGVIKKALGMAISHAHACACAEHAWQPHACAFEEHILTHYRYE